jgi:hypothetical protein
MHLLFLAEQINASGFLDILFILKLIAACCILLINKVYCKIVSALVKQALCSLLERSWFLGVARRDCTFAPGNWWTVPDILLGRPANDLDYFLWYI